MRSLSLVGLAGALTLVAGACGDSLKDALKDALDEYSRAVCEAEVACNSFPDVDTCLATIPIDKDFLDGLAIDVRNGIADLDRDRFDDCLGLIEDSSSCQVSPSASAAARRTCGDRNPTFFTGTVALGDSCTEDVQCAGDAFCFVRACPDECCLGTCSARLPLAEIGEDCSNAECVGGAFCDRSGITPQCAAQLDIGQACAALDACVDGAVCDLDFLGGGGGNCIALAEQGDSCDPSTNLGIACIRTDSFCDPSDSICKLRRDVGETCSRSDANCRRYATYRGDVCVQRPSAGESCVALFGEPRCLGRLQCIDGTCQRLKNLYCPLEDAS